MPQLGDHVFSYAFGTDLYAGAQLDGREPVRPDTTPVRAKGSC
jgi:hypothetical protein